MTICSRQSVQLYIRTCYIFFCKQKTAYEVRISDWSSDVCSSDLLGDVGGHRLHQRMTLLQRHVAGGHHGTEQDLDVDLVVGAVDAGGVVDGVGVDAAATQPELDAAALGDPEIGPLADHLGTDLGGVDAHRVVAAVADLGRGLAGRLHVDRKSVV